ncbi:EutN/CcmL family microcompartment protein [Vagococcus carniphilus]|uniref:Ethanolamine utilization protein EutN n=1 Tax=Vagococcus carniphilus TaxID=218144 RepID=A0A430B1J3_9ENTE|nr:EutN/CcmL family microcompartment protein [Vagococcus carniphilus]MDT2815549.1 EutN/CcmL family microcompartment protein [Vagococcus carniphilus]MDT2830817.1 EutN/CcmL family microcompartment protein [Vagococcus carniphilus]MDT2834490.1 EutN/CcmL family microcompartment protein [Vagococcus carniphilus]MDT2839411.1 EutN/CcmL family microcompartment protein [Vagococcus carniphilus]MDT2848570.1 EutN/CcmL family microcompartment protein [Vagococcus carniphilus]
MYMGRVVGSIEASQKDDSLIGRKLMIVQQINSDKEMIRYEEVASDTVGAGIGEYVLLVKGAGARKTNKESSQTRDVVDCAIVGIIDRFNK